MTPTSRALESLLAFWIDSGVDAAVADSPVDHTAAGALASPTRRSPLPQTNLAPISIGAAPTAGAAGAPDPQDLVLAIDQAREAAAQANDLASLEAAIASFGGCPLKASARRTVFARGPPDAPIMIIGEAPGADEDAQGQPFVGRAGQLLDRMLIAASLADRVFITNTVFWRPPGNRAPTPSEQAVCYPFVERAITLVNPRALVLAGGASAKHLLARQDGILALRGRWFEWRSTDETLEIPALPTLHPAFLLRQPAAKKKSWTDLLMLVERIDRPARPE